MVDTGSTRLGYGDKLNKIETVLEVAIEPKKEIAINLVKIQKKSLISKDYECFSG